MTEITGDGSLFVGPYDEKEIRAPWSGYCGHLAWPDV